MSRDLGDAGARLRRMFHHLVAQIRDDYRAGIGAAREAMDGVGPDRPEDAEPLTLPETFTTIAVNMLRPLNAGLWRSGKGGLVSFLRSVVRVTILFLVFPAVSPATLLADALRRRRLRIATVREPGTFLRRLSTTVFGREAWENRFEQVVADMQHQYYDARERRARWEARFAILRGYLAFGRAVAVHMRLDSVLEVLERLKSLVS